MANLSPFQRGFGSLQLFSVHQNVPNGLRNDKDLTCLRQDGATANAPGVFYEPAIETDTESSNDHTRIPWGKRIPEKSPELVG